MRLSMIVPFVPPHPDAVLPFAERVHRPGGPGRLWLGQSWVTDPVATLAHVAGAGLRVPVGLGVLVTPSRHPVHAALEARTLATTTGHAPTVAFGPGSPTLQRQLLGAPLDRPVSTAGTFLTAVRGELGDAGPGGGVPGLPVRVATTGGPRPRLGLGVLRRPMAELAGRVADVAVTWLTPADHLRHDVVPALERGAAAVRAAGRPELVAVVAAAPDASGADPVAATLAGSRGHLEEPHYRDMLTRAGLRLGATDDDGAAALVDGGAVLHGDRGQLAAGMEAFAAAGVDELVVNLAGVHALRGPAAVDAGLDALTDAHAGARPVR